jgi:hypothetical protein
VVGDGHKRLFAQQFEALGVVEEDESGRSQLYGFAGAIEKSIAVFLLELADLGANRGLGAKYLLAGAGKTALLGDFQERDELIEIH